MQGIRYCRRRLGNALISLMFNDHNVEHSAIELNLFKYSNGGKHHAGRDNNESSEGRKITNQQIN